MSHHLLRNWLETFSPAYFFRNAFFFELALNVLLNPLQIFGRPYDSGCFLTFSLGDNLLIVLKGNQYCKHFLVVFSRLLLNDTPPADYLQVVA